MSMRDQAQRPIVFKSVAICVVMAIAAIFLGFVVLGQRGEAGGKTLSLWDSICLSMGIGSVGVSPSNANLLVNDGSTLVWNAANLKIADQADREHGAYLGDRCVACHGSGVSSWISSAPVLWGVDQRSIFKQLIDYREGRRVNPLMQEAVAGMDDQSLASIAAYFASRPGAKPVAVRISPAVSKLIEKGDPQRGLTACSACHGPAAYVTGAPRLFGMPKDYIKTQIAAFAVGTRKNDNFQQMRIVARTLTPEEIDELAVYYSGRPDTPDQKLTKP